MASINVSQADFDAVADAGFDAKRSGADAQAAALDKIARKINASLSRGTALKFTGGFHFHSALTWKDMPSLFEDWNG